VSYRMRTLLELMAARFFEWPKWPTKIFPRCVSQNTFGTHLVIRGMFLCSIDITQIIRPPDQSYRSASRCAARKEPAIRAGHRALHYVSTYCDSLQICFFSQSRSKNLHFLVPDPLSGGLHYEDLFYADEHAEFDRLEMPKEIFAGGVPKWPLAVT
jgi:hypothetical protein